jgi:hypothetical protein
MSDRICTKPNHIGRFFKCDNPRGTSCMWGCKYAALPAIQAGIVRRDMMMQIRSRAVPYKQTYMFDSGSYAANICEMVIRKNIGGAK